MYSSGSVTISFEFLNKQSANKYAADKFRRLKKMIAWILK